MEWYGFTSFTLGIIHFVAFLYLDVVHFDGTSFFAAHYYFRTDYLSCVNIYNTFQKLTRLLALALDGIHSVENVRVCVRQS